MIKREILLVFCLIFCTSETILVALHNHKQDKNKAIWFNLELNGKKIGYLSFLQQYKREGENRFIVRKEETFMRIRRSNHVIEKREYSVKTMDFSGRLLNFHFRSEQGNSYLEIKGDCDYKKRIIKITYNRNGRRKLEELNHIENSLTEYQALTVLKNRGWVEGDSISYSNLMIEKGSYIDVEMKLEKIEERILDSEKKILYKVARTIENIPQIQSVTWVDSELIPHRGELIFPSMRYTLKPTIQDEALELITVDPAALNLAKIRLHNSKFFSIDKYRNKIKKIELFLKLPKGEQFLHDLDGGFQKIRSGNLKEGLRLIIDTRIPREIENTPIKTQSKSFPSFLESNVYIESDDKKIKSTSQKLEVKESAWETALKIKNWVYNNIKMNFKTGFASAVEVFQTREGDCTEHAVLTAALCRAAGIPTRIAIGYHLSLNKDKTPDYIGHMWNEVSVDGIWIPIDSTVSKTMHDPFKIRFFSSSLNIQQVMKKTALFPLTENLEITLLSTTPSFASKKTKEKLALK